MCLKVGFHRSILAIAIIGRLIACGGFSPLLYAGDPTADEKAMVADSIYEPGGDVRPPKLIHYVEPKFSGESKEAFVEGTVKISTVVTTEGEASDCHVTSGLTESQDNTAMEALRQWRFQPGTKAGKAVRVRVTVEVGFHLL